MLAGASEILEETRRGDPVMTMTVDERAQLLAHLGDASAGLLDMVELLTDAQWVYRPGPDRWTVGENVEHLTAVEHSVFSRVQETLTQPEHPEWETATHGKADIIERVLLDRGETRAAPQRVRPTGSTGKVDGVRAFREAREATATFVRETDAALKALTYDHHRPIYGTLSLYQWLLFLGFHNRRHNEQIAEVVATSDFPR